MTFNPTDTDGAVQVITRGSGRIFMAELDSDENPTGLKYVGETPSFSFTTATETTPAVQSSDGAVPTNLIAEVNTYSISAGLNITNLSVENIERFFLGNLQEIQIQARAVSGEKHMVSGDTWVQLGSTPENPMGVNAVSDTGFTASGGSSISSSNYTLIPEAGMVFFKAAAVTGTEEVTVGYTPVATTKRVVNVPVAPENKKYALRYIEDQNISAEQWNIYIPVCQTFPEGTFEVKSRTDTVSLPLSLTILNPAGRSNNMHLEIVKASS